MYHFITWVIEYSEDDTIARLLFVLALPLLLGAKVVLRSGEAFGNLFRRREESVLVPATSGDRGSFTY
jgi:hypothetical protein